MSSPDYAEFLKPLELSLEPETVDDCVYACYEEHGAGVPHGKVVNTVRELGWADSVGKFYFSSLCTAAHYSRLLKDSGLVELSVGQGLVLTVNTCLRLNEEERLYNVGMGALADGMTVREAYEAVKVPYTRRLLSTRSTVKQEEFIETMTGAPSRISRKDMDKYRLFLNRMGIARGPEKEKKQG